MTLEEIRNRIADLRNRRALSRKELEQIAIELSLTTDDASRVELTDRIDVLRDEMRELRRRETEELSSELNPLVHVPALDGAIPILLAPLRIHTRFDRQDNALLIRVYPDTFSIENHERRLTRSERRAGNSYWVEANVPATEPQSRGLWRGIVSRFGLRRAAWIIRTTKPDAPQFGDDIDEPVRIPAAWTLPERLIFLLYGVGDALLVENLIGSPIPDGLEMSFDITKPKLGFSYEAGELKFPSELLWQVDFKEAIKVGMGISVPLDRIGSTADIKRLTVLGVRLSTDERESAALLEGLIESHRHTDGFSIMSQGTPTNVTEDSFAPTPKDVDDALDWLRGKGGFDPAAGEVVYDDEPDGLRLAHALGVRRVAMQFIENSGRTDAKEAIAMKRALWAGTLGYYIQQMLHPVLTDDLQPALQPDSPERLILAARFFFTNFVFGRGPLPALRVGSQPYGILPVCGDMLSRGDPQQFVWNDSFVDAFLVRLHDKMVALSRVWLEQISNVPRAGAGPNANARLLDVLATQASSVEWHMERLMGSEYLREYTSFKGKALAFDAYAQLLAERFAKFQQQVPNVLNDRARIFDLTILGGYWKTVLDELKNEIKQLEHGASIKLTGDVIDNFPLSESSPINSAYPNYIKWMAHSPFDRVLRGLARTKPNSDPEPVQALLYLALRYSYLYEHAFTAMRFHARYQNKPWKQFVEKDLYNMSYEYETLPWDLISREKSNWQLGGMLPSQGSVLNFIEGREDLKALMGLDWRTMFGDIDEMLSSLKVLANLHTAPLERLFAEHMDLASYRIDAWFTGYTFCRLLAYRVWRAENQQGNPNPLYETETDRPQTRFALNHRPLGRYSRGIYLGAYGWVEDLKADAIPEVVDDLHPDLIPRNGRPVTRDADNYGLVHAPSLNHAVTAAMLRSASVTQPDVTAFNVDLSSTRVRDALWIMEGVRNGQMLAALLGYRFERSMRQQATTLLEYLPGLRREFPMPRQPDTDPGAQKSVTARDVVNGLLIIQARRENTLDAKLTSANVQVAHRAPLAKIADELIDTFDACGDLMLAEAVHHSAQGDYSKAGGVVTAAGEFTHVPAEFDVVNTPRSGNALSHRLLLAFKAGAPAAPGSGTPRSRLEPAMNQWIGSFVGDQSKLSCSISYIYDAEQETRKTYSITLDKLKLEPIDLLFAFDDRVSEELGRRLDYILRPRFEHDQPETVVKKVELDHFKKGAQGTRPAGEVIQLLHQIRSLVSSSNPATMRDFVAPRALHGFDQKQMEAINENELMERVLGVRRDNPAVNTSSLWSTFEATKASFDAIAAMAEPVSDAAIQAAVTQIETALLAAAAFGIPEAVPRPPTAESRFSSLRNQATSVKTAMDLRFKAAREKWEPPAPPEVKVLEKCRDVTEVLLGGGFPLMPRVTIPQEFSQAALAPGAPSDEAKSDWLFLAATVREDAAKLQRVRVLSDEFEHPLAALQIFQWPETQKAWIGETAPANVKFEGDLVSIVVQAAGEFDATETATALIIDEWQEVIPNKDETTGIAFHYDAPNAEPPQALLLAVSRRSRANNLRWMWDELVDSVNQALVLAKIRAVGPDELHKTPLDAVLPATMSAEAAKPATIATGYIANIDSKTASKDLSLLTRIE